MKSLEITILSDNLWDLVRIYNLGFICLWYQWY